jgi:hypothetical protein
MRSRSIEPLIKPQPKIQLEPCNFRIDTDTRVKLQAYSEFIHSEQSYVIREALNYLFESDSTFQEFFSSRPKSESATHETS